jgi:hypothetical protein
MDIRALGNIFTELSEELYQTSGKYMINVSQTRSSSLPCMRSIHFELMNITTSSVIHSFTKTYNSAKEDSDKVMEKSEEEFAKAVIRLLMFKNLGDNLGHDTV